MKNSPKVVFNWVIIAFFLLAGCGEKVGVEMSNAIPTAHVSSVQRTVIGSAVILDGSGSSDANHDALNYHWTIVSKPDGSTVTVSSPSDVRPHIAPDLAGLYVFNLVVNDGKINSSTATFTVTASLTNTAPVAQAGGAQSSVVGALVTLDGSGSSDANHDVLSYVWTLTDKPVGSSSELAGRTTVKPTFKPDVAGTYTCSLVVADGIATSTPATVTVTVVALNIAPVANAGGNQNVVAGTSTLVTLDGSGSSDTNGDTLTYHWSFVSKPTGSIASLSDPTAVNPTFIAYDYGTYVISLVVNDGTVDSTTSSTVTVTASKPDTIVSMVTNYGTIKISLNNNLAPISVNNFISYVNSGFYNNTLFHRVIPGFMIQGGGYTAGSFTEKTTNAAIKNEATNGLKNLRGTIAMARTTEVDSATAQFFINVVDNAFLDHTDTNYGYAVFGRVISGLEDVVDAIAQVTTTTSNGLQDVPVTQVVITSVVVVP